MTTTTMGQAYALVSKLFADKTDKGGNPYFEHCLSVMNGLCCNATFIERLAALGHDVIEDIEGGRDILLCNGWPLEAIEIIESVSKVPGETDAQYKAKVKANDRGIKVKMSDLRNNSDIRRMKNKIPTARDIQRVIGYMEFYGELEILAKERGLI
ncbi:hypothetical protein AHP1_591 [Aeromonas phage Ahp1_CNU-2021]|nr:hypothetical protein AHP1_591 [Aeromonas phage Ahp1_CNU-2021]